MTTATKEKKPTYKIFVLDSKEYDSLHRHYPMKKEDLEGSLGFAYGKTGEAFIRRTGVQEWDEETIIHEAEELLAKHSSHEDENNIRWKKGKNIFSSIIPMIVGALLAPLTGGMSLIPALGIPALGAAGSAALTGKFMSDEKKVNPLSVVLSGLGGGLGAAGMAGGMAGSSTGSYLGKLGSGLLGTAPTSTAAGTAGLLGSGGKVLGMGAGNLAATGATPLSTAFGASQAANPLLGSPATLGGVTSNITGGVSRGLTAAAPALSSISSIANLGSNLLGKTPSIGAPSIAPSSSVATQPSRLTSAFETTQKQRPFEFPTSISAPATQGVSGLPAVPATEVAPAGILSKLGKQAGELITPKNILGAGMTLASTMGKQPEYPEVDIESLRTSLLSGEGISPLGQQARAKLSSIMSAKPGELYPTGTDAYYQSAMRQTEVAYQRAQESLAKRYNMFDPNYQQSGEYQELTRRLDKELADVKSDFAIQEEQRRFELSRSQQYQAVQQALQVDEATMRELIGLTGLSIDQAAKKYQVAVDDVNEIRKALGGLGGQLISSGLQTSNQGATQ